MLEIHGNDPDTFQNMQDWSTLSEDHTCGTIWRDLQHIRNPGLSHCFGNVDFAGRVHLGFIFDHLHYRATVLAKLLYAVLLT
jgi:hypothetical protein